MMKIIFISGLLFLFLSVAGLATQNTTYTCVDTNTSMERIFMNIDVSGNTTNVTLVENQTCNNGCNSATGECNSSSFDSSNFILFLIFPIVSFVLLYFVSILKSEDWAVHLLLMIAAIAFLVAPLGILQGMQEQANNTFLGIPMSGLYMFLVVVMILIIFYYILKLIINAVRLMKAQKAGGVPG